MSEESKTRAAGTCTPTKDEANQEELDTTAQQQAADASTPPVASSGSIEQTGAPPSNTAPANYIDDPSDPRVLRLGIDSLYLSYKGTLNQDWAQRLEGLKLAARSPDPEEQALAQTEIGGHLFEVLPRGRGKYAYVLVDNHFQISIAGANARALPLAYVQISSELLTAIGARKAESKLRFIINTLNIIRAEPQLSRCDLFVDFLTECDPATWHPSAWVTRAHRVDQHHVRRRFSGWSIGLGGPIGARLYDKTLEIEKSGKDYLIPLWLAAGWNRGETVWRLEFQFNREVLKELGVVGLDDLFQNRGGMWRYAMESWLRLTLPNKEDTNQTRWPMHPLWTELSRLHWDHPDSPTLTRVKKSRIPSDESLFGAGLGGLTSFMAREGITEIDVGFGEFFASADRYYRSKQRQTGVGFRGYIRRKVALKGKKYNTIQHEQPGEEEAIKAGAEAYRRARDGE